MWILPADHHIGNEDALAEAVRHAHGAAQKGYLATFGIRPHRPETGYGYIRTGERLAWGGAHKVDSFVEKPDLDTAKAFLETKNYLWNSGMFFFGVATLLEEYETHASGTLRAIEEAIRHAGAKREAAGHIYAEIADQPFDKSIMEKSSRVSVVPCDPAWSDIGSWESLWEMHEKDEDGNVLQGRAACHDTKNCLIQANSRMVACAGVENIVVIETPDALLVADRSNADAMRTLVKALKNAGYLEMIGETVIGERIWQGSVTPLHPEQQAMRGAA
jgi:mannose-1-phosphate guanylyltransferase